MKALDLVASSLVTLKARLRPARLGADWANMLRLARLRMPRGFLHWASVVLLWILFASYAYHWVSGNWEMLTDPRLQNDDARTALFPFHRYEPGGALRGDPIAEEMLAYISVAVATMYRVFVPLTDLFVASKIVQGIALLVAVVAALVLAFSRRAGLGAGLLLLFLLLHDEHVINRVAGGHSRAFAFPCFALWVAGVASNRRWIRWGAGVLSALTYPSAMTMVLAAEGLFVLRGLFRGPWRTRLHILRGRLLRYAALVAVCFAVSVPALMGGKDRGPAHTLAQAQQEPAFGKRGRLWVLPFDDPLKAFPNHFMAPLKPHGKSLAPAVTKAYAKEWKPIALSLLGLLALAVLLRLTPVPYAALASGVGIVIMYWIARLLAFKLYSPERYYSFGSRMLFIACVVVPVAGLASWLAKKRRATIRNFVAAGLIGAIWLLVGDGITPRNGMTIDARANATLYAFIRKLPLDVRFACHPMDCDGVPYFGARANVGGFETLQPWFVDSWKRQKTRAQDTLAAIYARNWDQVLDYSERYHVTHFLLDTRRYGKNFVYKSATFEPLTQYAFHLLRGVQLEELVFSKIPKEAIVHQTGAYTVVDVARLRKALGR